MYISQFHKQAIVIVNQDTRAYEYFIGNTFQCVCECFTVLIYFNISDAWSFESEYKI